MVLQEVLLFNSESSRALICTAPSLSGAFSSHSYCIVHSLHSGRNAFLHLILPFCVLCADFFNDWQAGIPASCLWLCDWVSQRARRSRRGTRLVVRLYTVTLWDFMVIWEGWNKSFQGCQRTHCGASVKILILLPSLLRTILYKIACTSCEDYFGQLLVSWQDDTAQPACTECISFSFALRNDESAGSRGQSKNFAATCCRYSQNWSHQEALVHDLLLRQIGIHSWAFAYPEVTSAAVADMLAVSTFLADWICGCELTLIETYSHGCLHNYPVQVISGQNCGVAARACPQIGGHDRASGQVTSASSLDHIYVCLMLKRADWNMYAWWMEGMCILACALWCWHSL